MSTRRGSTRSRARGTGTTSTRGTSLRGRGGAQGKKVTPAREAAQQPETTISAPSMNARPRRENANVNPAQIIHDNTQHRRTSEQVKNDKAQAKADAASAIDDRRKRTEATIQHLATVEDRIQQKDLEYNQYAARPDLREPVLPPKKRSKYLKGS